LRRAQEIQVAHSGAASFASTVPLPFTRREHEITTLLSRGLSNRDVAEAMSLSVRTVEGHIYQASTKAGVTSRSELSALVKQFQQLGAAPNG
jgi:DNA-binding NarL/FixJ family response regulator